MGKSPTTKPPRQRYRHTLTVVSLTCLVDYTGAKVTKGQELAVLYSPDLYSDQVGLLSAKKALQESKSDRSILKNANQRMYENSRQRLIEFGIPESEIDIIEERGKPG